MGFQSTLHRIIVFFALATLGSAAPLLAVSWQTIENCDMAAASLQDLKTANREDCESKCLENKECQGVVYISGWGKCQLKANVKKHAKLRFISGELDTAHQYQTGSFKADKDHTGKDLERLVLDDADACGQACVGKKDCSAFTYLEGYRVCWLKRAGGRYKDKVFSCSLKKE